MVDPRIFHASDRSPNRSAFLGETLADLRQQLRQLGADLVLRAGDTVSETMAVATTVGAKAVYFTHDVTGFAVRRARHLREAALTVGIEVLGHPGVSVLEPGAVRPQGGGDHFKVFTPYWRHWSQAERRPVGAAPGTLVLPAGIDVGDEVEEVVPAWAWAGASPERALGGEGAAQRRLSQWRHAGGPNGYADNHDRLAADLTSRLSPYLHFGCLSALELARSLEVEVGANQSPGVQALLRQLCWRDFYHQVTAAFPAIASRDYRPGPAADTARADADTSADTPTAATGAGQDGLVQAWKDGRTGYPVVDAGMRQLRAEGWMHNRARLITASFLVKDLGVDWRVGAAHFRYWLSDGDVAQNSANWQWMAGTGNDTRPNRMLSPHRQAERFDPDGSYVRRYVPELDRWAARATPAERACIHRPHQVAPGRGRLTTLWPSWTTTTSPPPCGPRPKHAGWPEI